MPPSEVGNILKMKTKRKLFGAIFFAFFVVFPKLL